MKNFKKRLIALIALSCVALTSVVGCSDKNSSSKNDSNNSSTDTILDDIEIEAITNEDAFTVINPFQYGSIQDGINSGLADVNAPDPTSPSSEKTTVYEAVLDENKQPVTEVVTATNAEGETVTEYVPVTTIVESSGSEYVSATDGRYIFWLDISKDQNFLFEDQFIKITFKIKDNAPEKDYPITINPDLANVKGESLNKSTKVMNGTIRVGGSIEAADVSSENGLVVYGDKISCKPGDTVDYYINIKNNPGLVTTLIWFYFDSNAMDFVTCEPVGGFADIATRTQTGTTPANK